jgi:hypothetical protein
MLKELVHSEFVRVDYHDGECGVCWKWEERGGLDRFGCIVLCTLHKSTVE